MYWITLALLVAAAALYLVFRENRSLWVDLTVTGLYGAIAVMFAVDDQTWGALWFGFLTGVLLMYAVANQLAQYIVSLRETIDILSDDAAMSAINEGSK